MGVVGFYPLYKMVENVLSISSILKTFQERQLSVSGERMCIILVNRLED